MQLNEKKKCFNFIRSQKKSLSTLLKIAFGMITSIEPDNIPHYLS